MPFIEPALPALKANSPDGQDWRHEVEFDGWRVQIHKQKESVHLYSRHGRPLLDRFPDLRDHLVYLPDCIIDGELVACESDGKPDFAAITQSGSDLCIWCFDLLALADEDLRESPLSQRKQQLRELLIYLDDERLRYSEEFSDPVKLLAVAEKMGLERVVSKRPRSALPLGQVLRLGEGQAPAWREANNDRGDLFDKQRKVSA